MEIGEGEGRRRAAAAGPLAEASSATPADLFASAPAAWAAGAGLRHERLGSADLWG